VLFSLIILVVPERDRSLFKRFNGEHRKNRIVLETLRERFQDRLSKSDDIELNAKKRFHDRIREIQSAGHPSQVRK
jgi:hypothetical protein